MADAMDTKSDASGRAALSICESLLLALTDLKVISADEAAGVLHDAAAAHRHAPGTAEQKAVHLEAVALIERVAAGAKAQSRR